MRSLGHLSAGRCLQSLQIISPVITEIISCRGPIGSCAWTGIHDALNTAYGRFTSSAQEADMQQQQQQQLKLRQQQQPDQAHLWQLVQQDQLHGMQLQMFMQRQANMQELAPQQQQQSVSYLSLHGGSSSSSRAYTSSSFSSAVSALRGQHSLHNEAKQLQLQLQQQLTRSGHLLLRHCPLPLQQQQQQPCFQLQQHRGIKQLIPHALAPKPLPRFRKSSKDGRMNRMVIRIPSQVEVALHDNALTLTGKAGTTSLKLPFLDPTGLVAWQAHIQSIADSAAGPGNGSLLLLASPSKRYWRGIQTHINNAVHGVMQGYLVGLTVQGVGYRMEPVPEKTIAAALAAKYGATPEGATAAAAAAPSSSKRRIIWEQEAEKTNIAYPHKEPAKAVRLKVGYTRACIFQLPEGVQAFFVKPTLMYLYGIDKALVTNTAAAIRAVRKPNAYTGNGIQLVGEVLKLKQRAGSK